jgi:prevent-host-death family protein
MLANSGWPGSVSNTRMFSSAQAENQFGELIDAARLALVAVTKYDKPFVVVMAVEEFERLSAGDPRSSSCDKAKNGPRKS